VEVTFAQRYKHHRSSGHFWGCLVWGFLYLFKIWTGACPNNSPSAGWLHCYWDFSLELINANRHPSYTRKLIEIETMWKYWVIWKFVRQMCTNTSFIVEPCIETYVWLFSLKYWYRAVKWNKFSGINVLNRGRFEFQSSCFYLSLNSVHLLVLRSSVVCNMFQGKQCCQLDSNLFVVVLSLCYFGSLSTWWSTLICYLQLDPGN